MTKLLFIYSALSALFLYGSAGAMEERINNVEVSQKNDWFPSKIQAAVGVIKDIKFSLDGKRMVVMGDDCEYAEVWDLETERLNQNKLSHAKPIICVTFRPQSNHIATGSSDGKIKLWDGVTVDQIRKHPLVASRPEIKAFGSIPHSIAFSSNAEIMLIGTENGTSVIRKSGPGQSWPFIGCVGSESIGVEGILTYVSCNDSKNLIFAATDDCIKAYCSSAGEDWKLIGSSNTGGKKIKYIKHNGQGDRIFMATIDTNGHSEGFIIDLFNQTQYPVTSISDYSPQTERCLSIAGNKVYEYDPNKKEEARCIVVDGRSRCQIQSAKYNASGNQIIAIDKTGVASVWNKIHGCDYWQFGGQIEAGNSCMFLNPYDPELHITATLGDGVITIWRRKQSINYTQSIPHNNFFCNLEESEIDRLGASPRVEIRRPLSSLPLNCGRGPAPQDFQLFDFVAPRAIAPTILNTYNLPSFPILSEVDRKRKHGSILGPKLANASHEEAYKSKKTPPVIIDLVESESELQTPNATPYSLKNSKYDLGYICSKETSHLSGSSESSKGKEKMRDCQIQELDDLTQPKESRALEKQKQIEALFFMQKSLQGAEERGVFRKTLIDVILKCSDEDIRLYIAQFKGDLNKPDREGRTAVFLAVMLERQAVLDVLIKYKADVNRANSNKTTPLHIAVSVRNIGLVRSLINAGADIWAENDEKISPMTMVFQSKNKQLVDIFCEKTLAL